MKVKKQLDFDVVLLYFDVVLIYFDVVLLYFDVVLLYSVTSLCQPFNKSFTSLCTSKLSFKAQRSAYIICLAFKFILSSCPVSDFCQTWPVFLMDLA